MNTAVSIRHGADPTFRDLDLYADGGALLRQTHPDPEDLPEHVKTASFASSERLAPEDYAAILVRDGRTTPVWPINDPGNTSLSTHYFLHKHAALPPALVKTAATNLAIGCRMHGLEIPETLLKLAGVKKASQLSDADPYVDVRPGTLEKRAGSTSGLKREGRQKTSAYAYDDVVSAVHFYDENRKRMALEERLKLAQLLSPACTELGIDAPDEIHVLANGHVDPALVKVAFEARLTLVRRDPARVAEYEKIAHLEGEDVVVALYDADVATGVSRFWGTRLPDPLLSVMRIKQASEKRWQIGNDFTDTSKLTRLAVERRDSVVQAFGENFADKFQKDPPGIFSHLPDDAKQILARLSQDQGNFGSA